MELKLFGNEMDFPYKKDIDKLIYALVTYKSDISFPLIKLSQCSSKPVRIHFKAIK